MEEEGNGRENTRTFAQEKAYPYFAFMSIRIVLFPTSAVIKFHS